MYSMIFFGINDQYENKRTIYNNRPRKWKIKRSHLHTVLVK